MTKKSKKKVRYNVPCGCRECGPLKQVPQHVRQQHLKRDRQAERELHIAVQGYRAVQETTTALGQPSTSFAPVEASFNENIFADYVQLDTHDGQGSIRDMEVQAQALRANGTRDGNDGGQGAGAGVTTPEDEGQAIGGFEPTAEMLAPTPSGQPDVVDPICDDNWEDPQEEFVGEIAPQMPPPPPPPAPPSQQLSSVAHVRPARETFVPLSKEHENTPDPFSTLKPTTRPAPPPQPVDVHPQPGVYLLYMLASWLHLQFHLPFRACNVLVTVCLLIVKSFGAVISEPTPLVTLPRIMARLEVEPAFDILPLCPQCLEVYPRSVDTPSRCRKCLSPLFKPTKSGALPSPQQQRIPLLQAPFMSIQAQLANMLAVPGVEEQMDAWRTKPRSQHRYTDIFDGAVAKSLECPDGSLFFRNDVGDEKGPDGELRVGVTFGLDWFSYLRSQIAPSHSSCPISMSVANLPPHLRYRTVNLMLVTIMPGPKEQGPDECQRFLRVSVNELLRLWRDGFVAYTPSSPNGRLVRVILMCVCCDKPAAHKVGGFGSHSHTFFCTRCWISQGDKGSPAAFQEGGFRARTDTEHRMAGFEYANLTTDAARDNHVKEKAARWTELARLPYFDIVRMIVIDPMHNLLLGLVKTHFYHIWVQGKILRKTKELNALHEFLTNFQLPSYAGRLPALVGEPAGGSLTADQWMLLVTVVGPIAIPQIWSDFMSDPEQAIEQRQASINSRLEKKAKDDQAKKARAAAKKAAAAAAKAAKATSKQSNKRARTDENTPPTAQPAAVEPDEEEDLVVSCLHPDDPANFLKLLQAIRLLLRRDITEYELDKAGNLLRSYCTELLTLYGPDVIKPNHHYCIHTPDCVRDFGPLHEFWTFLFEQLNKVLKSYKTNNRNGGELETTFFREFHRTIATSRLVARSTIGDHSGLFQSATKSMFAASADDRGTVQALAQELDEARIDHDIQYSMSPRYTEMHLKDEMYHKVLRYLSAVYPLANLRSLNHPQPPPGSVPLPNMAWFFDYVVVRGRRYWASNKTSSKANSMVQVFVTDNGETCVGELLDVMLIEVNPQLKFALGHLRWLRPFSELGIDPAHTIWGPYQSLGVKLWHDGPALTSSSYPTLLPLHSINHQVALHPITLGDIKAYATVSLVN